jgi:hypothetical protein
VQSEKNTKKLVCHLFAAFSCWLAGLFLRPAPLFKYPSISARIHFPAKNSPPRTRVFQHGLPHPDASFSKNKKHSHPLRAPLPPKKTLTPGREFLTGSRHHDRRFLLLLILAGG